MSKSWGWPLSLYSGSDSQPSMTRLIESRLEPKPPSIGCAALKSPATVCRSTPVFTEILDTFGRTLVFCVLAAACTQTALRSASASGLVIPCSISSGAIPSKAACATLNAADFGDSPIRPIYRSRQGSRALRHQIGVDHLSWLIFRNFQDAL